MFWVCIMVQQSSEPDIRFHKERFLEAVTEAIARAGNHPERLGKARLHLALYYADMTAYIVWRSPITGAEYLKEPFGPAARYLDWALDTLERSGVIRIDRQILFGVPRQVFKIVEGRGAGASNLLKAEERAHVGFWAEWVCGIDQTDLSDFSHERPWGSVERYGDRVPYATAFMLLPGKRPPVSDGRRVG